MHISCTSSLRVGMAWKTPVVSAGVLHVPLETITIAVGSALWYSWLADEAHCSFHFSHPSGNFTARKERKQRGQQYWVAYRHAHGKLYKAYLGKPEVVNEDLLCATGQMLARAVCNNGDGGT